MAIRQDLAIILLSMAVPIAGAGCSRDQPSGQCNGFVGCGGNVEGTWAIGSSCVEGNLIAVANLNPKLPVPCQGMYESISGAMGGTVAFNVGIATLDTKHTASYQTMVNAECAASLGQASLDSVTCPNVAQGILNIELHQAAVCTWTDGRCHCSITDEFPTQATYSYSVSGSTISYFDMADGVTETGSLDFCAEGQSLHGRQFDKSILSTIFIEAQRQL